MASGMPPIGKNLGKTPGSNKDSGLPDFSVLNHKLRAGKKAPWSRPVVIILKVLVYFAVFFVLVALPIIAWYRSVSPSTYIDVLNNCFITIKSSQYYPKEDIKEIKYVLDALRKADFPDYKQVCKNVSLIKIPVTLCSGQDVMGCTQNNTSTIEVNVGKIMPSGEAAAVGGAIVHESCHIAEYKTGFTGEMELPCYLDQQRAEGSLWGYKYLGN